MIKINWKTKAKYSGLEIEGGYIKLAQAQDFPGGRKIIAFTVKKIASQSEKETVSALKEITAGLKGKIGQLTVSLPRHKVAVRFLRFPSVNEKEIAGMVSLQSAKELPYSKEETISDYFIIERTKDGYAKVALVIVHQDVVKGYLDIFKKAGLEPERITFSTEAILTWFRLALRPEKPSANSLLVDIDSDNTDIAVFSNSTLVFTRGLTWGFRQLQGQPNSREKLAREIRSTIDGYVRQTPLGPSGQEKQGKIGQIFLGPTAEAIEGLNPFLQQEFNQPCEMLVPMKNLTYKKGISFVHEKTEFSLLRVLGAALGEKTKAFNLLPAQLKGRRQLRLKRKKIGKISFLSLGVVLVILLILAKNFYDKQVYLYYLIREVNKTAPLAKQVEDMLKKINLIERRRKISASSIDILRELHTVVPAKIFLSSFGYDEPDRTVTLQGSSDNMAEIFSFINILERSELFKNVQLKYVSEKKAKATGLTDFKIECSLEQ